MHVVSSHEQLHMSGTSMINIAAFRWLTMHLVDRNAMWCVRCADAASGLHCTTARPIPIAASDAIVPRDPRTVGQNNNFVLTVDEICRLWKGSVAEDSFYCVDQDAKPCSLRSRLEGDYVWVVEAKSVAAVVRRCLSESMAVFRI